MCGITYTSTIAKILTEIWSLLQIGGKLKCCAVCRLSLAGWSICHEKI